MTLHSSCIVCSLTLRVATHERVLQRIQSKFTGPRAALEVRHLNDPAHNMKHDEAVDASLYWYCRILCERWCILPHHRPSAPTYMLYLLLPN